MSELRPDQVAPPPVPFDPELEAALAAVVDELPRWQRIEDIPSDRAKIARRTASLPPVDLTGGGYFTVAETHAPGPPGAPEVALLTLRPVSATSPTPCFYLIHGGGTITGDFTTVSDAVVGWARELGATIVSVEYRLAPESPHPAPVEDCYAGLVRTQENAADLGIDPGKIIVMGSSAGGCLAAATALLARDRGGPALAAQMLMCPMLDDRNDSASAISLEGRGVWDRRANDTGWTALLGDAKGGPDVSPYAAPARATDLSNLPPTYLDVGSAETFRDEVVAYASNIWRAGGIADLHVFAGAYHGYDGIAPHAAVSRETTRVRLNWLTRVLGG